MTRSTVPAWVARGGLFWLFI